ncbi:uncharacterized protein LOC142984606 [Anticarsia gemmatalis]|uniref:uncharacterized protein LOC142984606 n=1 Tax=Anticarsia gemmatalis TaxID=129554 RepID=UPI003F773ADE
MVKSALILIFGVIFNGAASQTLDYITSSPSPLIQNSLSSSCNNWDELLPTLKMIKSSSNIKKERLLNVVKIIKYLLSDEMEKTQCDKILNDVKNINEFQSLGMPDIDSIVDERLKPIKDALEDKNCVPNFELKNEMAKNNNTAELNKVLAKISAALAKVKESNENAESGVCRRKNEFNSITKSARFNIPCQKASDILKETTTFVVPKEAYCNLPANINLDSILKNPKVNSDNLPFKLVPNSVTCVDSDDNVAILFKPKKISLMQVYGNLLKKITITVLVPYFVSKING